MLGYQAWERYLDKMAREGWQLRDNGLLGMRFVQTEAITGLIVLLTSAHHWPHGFILLP